MEFFWWGLRGQVDNWDVRCAALDADEQLQRLAVPIAEALEEFDARWWSRLRALWSTAGLVLPQLGSVPHLIELMLQAKELHGKVREWGETAEEVRDSIFLSEKLVEQARLAPDQRTPIKTDRAQQARRSAAAAGQVLCRVSRLLPVVIAVEDAQLLDEQTLDLLRTVAASAESTGLIVLTIAPDRPAKFDFLRGWLGELERDRVLTAAGSLISQKLIRVSMTALPDGDLRDIAVSRLAEEHDIYAEGSPVVATIVRAAAGSPLLLHRLLDSPVVLEAFNANDATAIGPAVVVAAGDGDGRAEAWLQFSSDVRKGLCVAAVLGLLTDAQWLSEELEHAIGCTDLATLSSVSGWLVRSDDVVSFIDPNAQQTAGAHAPFELGAQATAIRRQLCTRIRQAQHEGTWTSRPLLLRLEALQAAVTDPPADGDRTDLAIELAELQARIGQSRARRLRVLGFLLDSAAKDTPLSSACYSAVAAGYLDLEEIDQAISVLRERLRVLSTQPSQHPDEALLVRYELARVLKAASQFTDAIDLLEQVLAASHGQTPINLDRVREIESDLYDCLSALWRWERAVAVAARRYQADQAGLGDHHWSTISWGNRFYYGFRHIGRGEEALEGYNRLVQDARTAFGPTASITFDLRSGRAATMLDLGTPKARDDAITAYAELVRDRLLTLGEDHADTLNARNELAGAYVSAGRLGEAIPLLEQTRTDRERILGPDHPDTLTSRNNLAGTYVSEGRLGEAIPLFEQTLADQERVLGPDHPDTLSSRNNLAGTYVLEGRLGEAIPVFERTRTDRERVLGPDHPDTLSSRNDLAFAYRSAGWLGEAIPLFERTRTDRQRVLGPDHPDTLTTRHYLAGAYVSAGRLGEAITLFEQTLADRERVLGPDHPDTLSSRNNLAGAYVSAGRLGEAITLFEQTQADRERVLGPDHPDTSPRATTSPVPTSRRGVPKRRSHCSSRPWPTPGVVRR